jgi:hypothetical protein
MDSRKYRPKEFEKIPAGSKNAPLKFLHAEH